MKLGAISDIHGAQTGGSKKDLAAFREECGLDGFLQVGDFGQYTRKFQLPLYWVYGNRETPDRIEELKNGELVLPENNIWVPDFTVVEFNGVRIAGINGAERPEGDGYMVKHPSIYDALEKFSPFLDEVDVFLSHETPISRLETAVGGHVCHTDSMYVRSIVEFLQPKVAFSGHWHLNMCERIGDTDCYCMGTDPRHDWLVLDTEDWSVTPWKYAAVEG